MKGVFIVYLGTGEYSDYRYNPVSAHSALAAANLVCETLNKRLREVGAHTSQDSYKRTVETDALEKEFGVSIQYGGAIAFVIDKPVPFLG